MPGEPLSEESASNWEEDAILNFNQIFSQMQDLKNNKHGERSELCGLVSDLSVGSTGELSQTLFGNYVMKLLSFCRSVGGLCYSNRYDWVCRVRHKQT